METIRWGLLSTARINRRLIPAIRASKQGKLVAVASRDEAKARAYAAEWGIPRSYGGYEDMLASPDIDAVYVSLPNDLHAEWTIKTLQAGKHVLCEKPFALTVDEVDRMSAASRGSGRVLQEGFMYLHHPQAKKVLEWVREGRLGDINLVRGIFSFSMSNRAGNLRLQPQSGGGALWDVGVYPLSFAQAVFGQIPEQVFGVQHIGETGVDETFSGILQYPGGQAAQITGSFEMPFHTVVDIHGTRGRITLNRPFIFSGEKGREVLFTPVDGKPEKLRVKEKDAYLCEVEDMHAAILDGKKPLIPLEESRNHIRTAVALYESARTGQVVRL